MILPLALHTCLRRGAPFIVPWSVASIYDKSRLLEYLVWLCLSVCPQMWWVWVPSSTAIRSTEFRVEGWWERKCVLAQKIIKSPMLPLHLNLYQHELSAKNSGQCISLISISHGMAWTTRSRPSKCNIMVPNEIRWQSNGFVGRNCYCLSECE